MYHKHIAYRRAQRERVIAHRERINANVYNLPNSGFAKVRGKLAKGKVHCSCPLCAAKSKQDRGVKSRSIRNYKTSDQRKFGRIKEQLTNIDEIT